MQVLYERSFEHNNNMCFVDYEESFDRSWLEKADVVLQNIGVDWWDRKLIWNFYKDQASFVQIEEGLSSA